MIDSLNQPGFLGKSFPYFKQASYTFPLLLLRKFPINHFHISFFMYSCDIGILAQEQGNWNWTFLFILFHTSFSHSSFFDWVLIY